MKKFEVISIHIVPSFFQLIHQAADRDRPAGTVPGEMKRTTIGASAAGRCRLRTGLGQGKV